MITLYVTVSFDQVLDDSRHSLMGFEERYVSAGGQVLHQTPALVTAVRHSVHTSRKDTPLAKSQ
jgi:hypothetical protein